MSSTAARDLHATLAEGQDDSGYTKQINQPFISFPKLNEKSGQLYPDLLRLESARNIVRSCSHPFPGAYIVLSDFDVKIRVWKAEIISDENNNVNVDKGYLFLLNKDIFVGFSDGILKVTNYEIEKKNFVLPQKKNLKWKLSLTQK